MTETVPSPTPVPASPSFWRWLRPLAPKVAEKTEKPLLPADAIEERLLSLLAGVHQQVVADAQHTEQLATLSRRRSEVRVSALEEQHRRFDIRLNDLLAGLKSMEKAAPAASLSQLHVELSELRRSVRLVASNQQEACKREDELQEHMCQRLKPLEERLSALEGEVLMARQSPLGEKVQVVEALDSETSFRSVETSNEELSTVLPVRMDQGLRQLEKHLDEEVAKIYAQMGDFSSSEAFIGTLSSRIAACEESCQRMDSFVERFKDLATKVQEGFADARGHLDQVLLHWSPKKLKKDELEEMRGALLEVKSSLESLTKQLEDPADEQLQAVQTLGIKKVRLPKNEGLTASPWSELAHLSSALDGFEAAIQQAEVSTARNGHLDSEASDEMDGKNCDLMNHLQEERG